MHALLQNDALWDMSLMHCGICEMGLLKMICFCQYAVINSFTMLRYHFYSYSSICVVEAIPDSQMHEANVGPAWVLSARDRPHVGSMNLAIWDDNPHLGPLLLPWFNFNPSLDTSLHTL